MIVNISHKGKTYKLELPKEKEAYIIGKRIGDVIEGDVLGLGGYKLKLTGGSDESGFPMRKDISGAVKKQALLSSPPGFRPKRKGERRRKTVRGNTYSQDIVQVNTVVVEEGKEPLENILGKKEEKKDAA